MWLYAIRHKPSGHFLPSLAKQRAGGTWAEPTADCIPRLFRKKQHAQSALAWWLQGHARWVQVQSSWESFGPDDVDLIIDPVPGRVAEDMEIVLLTLTLAGIYK